MKEIPKLPGNSSAHALAEEVVTEKTITQDGVRVASRFSESIIFGRGLRNGEGNSKIFTSEGGI